MNRRKTKDKVTYHISKRRGVYTVAKEKMVNEAKEGTKEVWRERNE